MYNCNLKKNYIGFNSKGKAIIMKNLVERDPHV